MKTTIDFESMKEGATRLQTMFRDGAPMWFREDMVEYFGNLYDELCALEAEAMAAQEHATEVAVTEALVDAANCSMESDATLQQTIEHLEGELALAHKMLAAETDRAVLAETKLVELALRTGVSS